jgi:hypothetical protein
MHRTLSILEYFVEIICCALLIFELALVVNAENFSLLIFSIIFSISSAINIPV